MKLISMTDFVRKSFEKVKKTDKEILVEYISICRYQEFLNKPLTIGMFIPCDVDRNIIKIPSKYKEWLDLKKDGNEFYFKNENLECEKYEQANEEVLFKNVKHHDIQPSMDPNYFSLNGVKFSIQNNNGSYSLLYGFDTIEKLLKKVGEVELTESAIKQIGL